MDEETTNSEVLHNTNNSRIHAERSRMSHETFNHGYNAGYMGINCVLDFLNLWRQFLSFWPNIQFDSRLTTARLRLVRSRAPQFPHGTKAGEMCGARGFSTEAPTFPQLVNPTHPRSVTYPAHGEALPLVAVLTIDSTAMDSCGRNGLKSARRRRHSLPKRGFFTSGGTISNRCISHDLHVFVVLDPVHPNRPTKGKKKKETKPKKN